MRRRGESTAERNERLKKWPSRLFAVLLVAAAGAVAIALYPHYVKVPRQPSILDQVFESRTIIVFIRVLAMFASGYLIASLLARIWNRQWLSKAGPFAISDVVDLTDDLAATTKELRGAEGRIEKLNDRIANSDQTIEELLDDLDGEEELRTVAEQQVADLRLQLADVTKALTEALEKLNRSEGSVD